MSASKSYSYVINIFSVTWVLCKVSCLNFNLLLFFVPTQIGSLCAKSRYYGFWWIQFYTVNVGRLGKLGQCQKWLASINQMFFLSDHMMVTSQLASPMIPGPGKGTTHSRGRSTSAPERQSSVALAPLSNGVETSEELIEHIRLKCRLGTFSSGRHLQTN